jgi:hypothetical protein
MSSNVDKNMKVGQTDLRADGAATSVLLSLHAVPATKEWRNSDQNNGSVKSFVSHCGVWRFAVLTDGSLWCLEIRCGVWRFAMVSGNLLWCLMSYCGVWRFAVVPDESLWCLEIRFIA